MKTKTWKLIGVVLMTLLYITCAAAIIIHDVGSLPFVWGIFVGVWAVEYLEKYK